MATRVKSSKIRLRAINSIMNNYKLEILLMLLGKFPAFDSAWPVELQQRWFNRHMILLNRVGDLAIEVNKLPTSEQRLYKALGGYGRKRGLA